MDYSTIEGMIRQSTNNPMRTEITPKQFKQLNKKPKQMIEELMYFIMTEHFGGELDPDHRHFDLYMCLQRMLEDCQK